MDALLRKEKNSFDHHHPLLRFILFSSHNEKHSQVKPAGLYLQVPGVLLDLL